METKIAPHNPRTPLPVSMSELADQGWRSFLLNVNTLHFNMADTAD